MDGISVNTIVLLINGVPQSFLMVLALQIFTGTIIEYKKFLLLSLICIVATYLIRFLPIALGVNSIITLLIMAVSFQFAYKKQLSKVIRTIVSAIGILILVAISEVFNMLLLTVLYGQIRAEELFASTNGLTRGIYTTPSNIFFALFILFGYFILKKIGKRKNKNGETGARTGE